MRKWGLSRMRGRRSSRIGRCRPGRHPPALANQSLQLVLQTRRALTLILRHPFALILHHGHALRRDGRIQRGHRGLIRRSRRRLPRRGCHRRFARRGCRRYRLSAMRTLRWPSFRRSGFRRPSFRSRHRRSLLRRRQQRRSSRWQGRFRRRRKGHVIHPYLAWLERLLPTIHFILPLVHIDDDGVGWRTCRGGAYRRVRRDRADGRILCIRLGRRIRRGRLQGIRPHRRYHHAVRGRARRAAMHGAHVDIDWRTDGERGRRPGRYMRGFERSLRWSRRLGVGWPVWSGIIVK